MKFCGECGAALRPSPAPPLQASPEAERRQLTVMFCDLADSTALAGELDLEELRDIVRQYQAACGAVLERYGGTVAQYLGDGLLIYFGYPEAHEDDPRRAARSAIEILGAVERLNEHLAESHGLRIAVRLGIHTGLVVAGEVGSGAKREQLALGQAPAIAARLQTLAAPGEIMVSGSAYRLIEDWFLCEPAGVHTLKGVATPVAVHRLLGGRRHPERFENGDRPLVGREREMAALQAALDDACAGTPRVALVVAGPGLGKSLLMHSLRGKARSDVHWLLARCSSFYADSAFHPLIELLEYTFGLTGADTAPERLARLNPALQRFGLTEPDLVALFAAFLSIPPSAGYVPLAITPQRLNERVLAALRSILGILAAERPLVFALEDLHWCDPSTLGFLEQLVLHPPARHLLVLITSRPPVAFSWLGSKDVARVDLEPLDRARVTDLVRAVAGGRTLPPAVLEHVLQKTDGIPLFVEELTRMILESGLLRESADGFEPTTALPDHAIPTTLHDSLMARLDRLETGKEVAQLAAVIGREFGFELLHAVSAHDEEGLRTALDRLVGAQLLVQRGNGSSPTYVFRHALIRDAAYESLLRGRRQTLHQRIADTLSDRFPEVDRTHPEVLAYHYTEAGQGETAIDRWIQAGRLAMSRGTDREAVRHLEKGLAVLHDLSATATRDVRELALQTTLGAARTPIFGYAAAPVAEAYERAGVLAEGMGDIPPLFWAIWGLGTFHIVRANLHTALELNQRLIRLSDGPDRTAWCEARTSLASTQHFRGDFMASRDSSEAVIRATIPGGLTDPLGEVAEPDTPHPAGIHHEIVTCLSTACLVEWCLGFPDRALVRARAAITQARRTKNPHSLGYALTYAARLHESRGEHAMSRALAEEVIALSLEHGLFWITQGHFFLGQAIAALAAPEDSEALEEGLSKMRLGVETFRATGARISQTYMLARVAEVELLRGNTEAARDAFGESRATMDATGERYWHAELERLGGDLALASGDVAGAEHGFRRAMQVAQAQEARSLALRAAIRLGTLWADQGRATEARGLLAPIVGWFTEGMDTGDIQRAKRLLQAW